MKENQEKNRKLNQNFFDRWSKSYDNPIFQFWMKGFQRQVFKELELNENTKLLDVGCGTGQFLSKLNELKGPAKLYGIDISEEMLKKAKQRLGSAAELKIADVHVLPFKENYFDYVISTEAFHHYGSQLSALKEMKRVAKPGRRIIISDINFFFKLIHQLFEKLEPGCVKVNSKKEMRKLFAEAGLTVIKQKRNFLFAVVTVGVK